MKSYSSFPLRWNEEKMGFRRASPFTLSTHRRPRVILLQLMSCVLSVPVLLPPSQNTWRRSWKNTWLGFPKWGLFAPRKGKGWSGPDSWGRPWPEARSLRSWTPTARSTSTGFPRSSVSDPQPPGPPGEAGEGAVRFYVICHRQRLETPFTRFTVGAVNSILTIAGTYR